VEVEPRLPHERPQRAGAPQPAQPRNRKGAHADNLRTPTRASAKKSPPRPTSHAASRSSLSHGLRSYSADPKNRTAWTNGSASERERDDARERNLRRDELARRDEPAREAADHVLVALRGTRARGEQQREERDRHRDAVRLHLCREHPRTSGALALHEADRIRRRLQRGPRLRERDPRDAHELADLREPLRRRQRREQPLRAVETEHVELLAEERTVAAAQDQRHVPQVRGDERALQLAVQLV